MLPRKMKEDSQCPEERFPRHLFDSGEIDFAAAEDRAFFVGKIFADNSDHADGREIACGQSEVARCASQSAIHLAEWGLDGVERNGTYD